MHGLEALVQVAVVNDAPQGSDDLGFKFIIHGQVGIVPIADHTHAPKIIALLAHLGRRVIPAPLAKLRGGYFVPGLADLFLDVEFNG